MTDRLLDAVRTTLAPRDAHRYVRGLAYARLLRVWAFSIAATVSVLATAARLAF